jgi:glutathione S-transferase
VAGFTLILGNKAYSSWSLRGWLIAKRCGVPFEEIVIPLDRPETKAEIQRHTPAGKVPVLHAEGLMVWDTLAIAEYMNERFPGAGLWPADPAARAAARCVAAEMHAGFAALRRRLPMDLKRPPAPRHGANSDDGLDADIERIQEIWSDCRARFGQGGDYLFGDFGAADAFFAPVATRFATYQVTLNGPATAYRDAVMSWPAMRDWIAAAKCETWVIANP